MRPEPDRIAQLPKRFEGGVFDNGFIEAHRGLLARHWFRDRKLPARLRDFGNDRIVAGITS